MKLLYCILLIVGLQLLHIGCSDNSEESLESTVQTEENAGQIKDGRYSATVEYYNPNTGTSNTYDLEVEVSDNEVTVIYFNNGGWLDETHIVSGGKLDEDGRTTIYTDKGYEYTVEIEK